MVRVPTVPLPELRAHRAEAEQEEVDLSYIRRMIQGRLDILRAELVNRMRTQREEGQATITGEDIEQLTEILSGKAAAPAEGE